MNRLFALYRTTPGKKLIVAVSGILMLGFLIGHIAGNLKVFLPEVNGTPDIDIYAEYLREIGVPLLPHTFVLWVARVVLLAALVLHVTCVIQLSAHNRSARQVDYRQRHFAQATPPARWMMYSGLYLLGFVILHLLQFTFGVVSQYEPGAVYDNLQAAFSHLPWAVLYVISMVVIGLHLYHGAWSLFQTVGLDNPDRNRGLRRGAAVLAVGLAILFSSIPVAFLTGVLKARSGAVVDENRPAVVSSGNATGEDQP